MKHKKEGEINAFWHGITIGLVSGITLTVAFLFAMLANFSLL